MEIRTNRFTRKNMTPLSPSDQLTIESLPDLPLINILSRLNPVDLDAASLACKTLQAYSHELIRIFARQSKVFSSRKIESSQQKVCAKVLQIVRCACRVFPDMKRINCLQFSVFANFLENKNLKEELSAYLDVSTQPIEFVKILIGFGVEADVKNLYSAIDMKSQKLVQLLLDSRNCETSWYNQGMVQEYSADKSKTVQLVKKYDICAYTLKIAPEKISHLVIKKLFGSLERFKTIEGGFLKEISNTIGQNVINLTNAIVIRDCKVVQEILKNSIWDTELEADYLDTPNVVGIPDRFGLCLIALKVGTPEIFLIVLSRLFSSIEEYLKVFDGDIKVLKSRLLDLLPLIVKDSSLRKAWYVIDVQAKSILKAIRDKDFESIEKMISDRKSVTPWFIEENIFGLWHAAKLAMDYENCCFALLKGSSKSFLLLLDVMHISFDQFQELANLNNLSNSNDRSKKVLRLVSNIDKNEDLKKQLKANKEREMWLEADTELDESFTDQMESGDEKRTGVDSTHDSETDSDSECGFLSDEESACDDLMDVVIEQR